MRIRVLLPAPLDAHQADDAGLEIEVERVQREDAPVPLRQRARLDERHRDSLTAGPAATGQ